MAHLAKVTSEFRIGLKLMAAALIIVAIIFVFFRGGELAKNIFFPTPPPPPEQKFGKLPKVQFPTQNSQNLNYRINTLTGKLPTFSDRMKVYKVEKREPSLVALKSTREKLLSSGYTGNESKISEQEYQWTNSSGQTIRINIQTGNFKIFSNFLNEEATPLAGSGTRKEQAYELFTRFLESLDTDTQDLDKEASTLTYLKLENGLLTKVQSLNEANFARFDLQQKNLEDYKIYYPGLTESLMHFTLKEGNSLSSVVDTSFLHSIADLSSSSTYAIKKSEAAFEDLKRGSALIFLDNEATTPIDITDVTLGYYIGDTDQEYFLPIVVFKGKGFTAYVNALGDQ